MGPLPEDLKKVIMSYHPGLTEREFSEYVSLEDNALMIDPLRYPDRKKEAEKELDAFIKKHLPCLEEAVNVYYSRIEADYEESVKKRLADPVEIAKSSKIVRDWLADRAGAYTVKSRLIREPYVYMVEFKSPGGSEIHVSVDRYNMSFSVVFQRIVR